MLDTSDEVWYLILAWILETGLVRRGKADLTEDKQLALKQEVGEKDVRD